MPRPILTAYFCCKCDTDFPRYKIRIHPEGERDPQKQRYICLDCKAKEFSHEDAMAWVKWAKEHGLEGHII